MPGIALLLEPTPEFYQRKSEKAPGVSWGFLIRYVKQYKRYFFQLAIGLLIASALQLVFPFLTQSIVDVGINTRNLNIFISSFLPNYSCLQGGQLPSLFAAIYYCILAHVLIFLYFLIFG